MKKILLFAFLAVTINLSAQTPGKEYTYAPLKWTVKIPAGFSEGEYDPENYNEEEEIIFSFEKGDDDTFEATVEPFDEAVDGDYAELQQMTTSFMEALLGDSATVTSTKETISGVEFYHHKFVLEDEGETFTMHLFNAYINGQDFCMNISYSDEALGASLIKLFRESKFK